MSKQPGAGSEEENVVDGDLSQGDYPMLNYFFQRYPPARSIKESELTMSTEEIRENLFDHSGMLFSVSQLYNWLQRKCYSQDTLGEGKFVWLIGDSEKF